MKHLRARDADLPVLILSMHDESIYAERALRAGANGYIMKQEATEHVLTAIRRILAGQVYLSDRMAARMLSQYRARLRHDRAVAARPPERSRARSVPADRRRPQYEGDRRGLHLSVKTVETYQAHVKEKLGLRNARELVQHAIQWRGEPTPLT